MRREDDSRNACCTRVACGAATHRGLLRVAGAAALRWEPRGAARTCAVVRKLHRHSTSVLRVTVTRDSRSSARQSMNAAAKGFSLSSCVISTHFLRRRGRARLGGAQPGPAPVPERGRRCSRRPESGDDSWARPSARVPQPGRSAPAATAPHVQGRPAQDAEQAVACMGGPRSCMCSPQGCGEHEMQ